jgi:hypothetical protein
VAHTSEKQRQITPKYFIMTTEKYLDVVDVLYFGWKWLITELSYDKTTCPQQQCSMFISDRNFPNPILKNQQIHFPT